MTEPYEFTERLFISQGGDYSVGGWLIDTRLWDGSDWNEFDGLSQKERFEWALRRTAQLERQFEKLTETLRNAQENNDIEVRRFVIDEDGVTEVDEDDQPI
ncbi:MAG: hypothetical protein ACKOQ8_05610 [Micrococcales bacterium]